VSGKKKKEESFSLELKRFLDFPSQVKRLALHSSPVVASTVARKQTPFRKHNSRLNK
jgi:hypothetical protein